MKRELRAYIVTLKYYALTSVLILERGTFKFMNDMYSYCPKV